MAVPLMAVAISPVKAAAILLPILLVMDLISVWSYRGIYDRKLLLIMVPGSLLGILLGAMLAGFVNERAVLVCVGLIAVIFPIYSVMQRPERASFAKGNKPLGVIAGMGAGFTSFVAHAGSPPFQAYAIPQGLEKRVFVGTSVLMFFVMNTVKLVPYFLLGQLDYEAFKISLYLIPLAPVGVLLGVWMVKRIDQQLFFRVMYVLIFIVGVKLLYDGFAS